MPRSSKRLGSTFMGYTLEEMIGWGATSKVYRGRHAVSGQVVAIKVIDKPRSRIGDLKRLAAECDILSKLKHPNIVEMNHWIETDKHIYIVMELAKNGDLLELINKYRQPFSEETVKLWFAQIVDALEYTHSQGYVHKDIKPDNILLDGQRVLLADWGFAHAYTLGERSCRQFNGTDGYWAPEVLTHSPFIGPELDCWSLGVTLFALAAGRLPFDRKSPTYLYDILQARFTIPSHVSPQLASLIRGLLNPDPVARFTIHDIKLHPFYASAKLPRSPPIEALNDLTKSAASVDVSRGDTTTGGKFRRATVFVTTKIHDQKDDEESFGAPLTEEPFRVPRDPASPPQSAPSSRAGSQIRFSDASRKEAREGENDERTPQQEQSTTNTATSSTTSRLSNEETPGGASSTEKAKKKRGFNPLKSVWLALRAVKNFPVKVFA